MKKLLKGIFAFVLASSCVTCIPTKKVEAATVSYALDRSGWSAEAYDSRGRQEHSLGSTNASEGPAMYLIDDNLSSNWHTPYDSSGGGNGITPTTDKPVWVVVTLAKEEEIEAFSWLNRNNTDAVKDWEFYINSTDTTLGVSATDGVYAPDAGWGEPVLTSQSAGVMQQNALNEFVLNEIVTTNQVMIKITSNYGRQYTTGCDFNLYDFDMVNNDVITMEESTPLNTEGFILSESGNSEEAGVSMSNIFDGNPKTHWTSQSVSDISNGDAWLKIDMGELKVIDRIDLVKRYDDGEKWACTGNIREYVIEVSETGEDNSWVEISSDNIAFDEDKTIYNSIDEGGTYAIEFDAIQTQYIRIRANKSYHWDSSQFNTCFAIGDLKIYGVGSNLIEPTKTFSKDTVTTITSGETTLEETSDVSAFKGLEEASINLTVAASSTELQSIFAFGDSTQENHYFAFYIIPNSNTIGVESRGDTNGYLVRSSVVHNMDYTLSHSYSLTWKKNGSSYVCTIYVDGEKVLSATSAYGFSMDDFSEMNYVACGKAIRSNNAKGYPFSGTMTNVEFYNKVISEKQISDYALPVKSSCSLTFEDYKLDGSNNKMFTLTKNEVKKLTSLNSGTISITYRLSDTTINKNMTLFSVSNNTSDNACYAVWVNPVTGYYGVNLNGNEAYRISSTKVQDHNWHTITIRNGTLNNTNGIHLSIDGEHVAGNRYTGDGRIGFYTLVSNANSATIGYIDKNSGDEKEFVGEISKIDISTTCITDAQLATSHSDAIAQIQDRDERWSDVFVCNEDYLYESAYNAFGIKPVAINTSTSASNCIFKYVNKNVLSVKAQAKQQDEEHYKLRFVTSVASLNPEECGFEYIIYTDEGTEFKNSFVDCSTVFTRIQAEDSFVDVKEVFNNNASEYFATFTISNVPNDVNNYTITLKPYWIPYKGSQKVYGVEKNYTLGDLFATVDSIPPVVVNE